MITSGGRESLAAQIRRVIAEHHGEEWPEPTDDQIREIARLLPPARRDGRQWRGLTRGTAGHWRRPAGRPMPDPR